MSNVLLTTVLLLGVMVGQDRVPHHAAKSPETIHLEFVKEYVRELISDEDIKVSGEKELGQAKTLDVQFSTGIYFSKSVQLELRSQIGMLKNMRLELPYESLIPDLIDFYQHEVGLHQKLIEMSSKFLAGPKPGVDYSDLAAQMPQLRAELEATQKAVFEAASMVFMTLIDMKPDSQGHASHLIITKEEKSDLQSTLDIILKGQPDHGDLDYYISAAMILRAGLLKGHKCSDEPWE